MVTTELRRLGGEFTLTAEDLAKLKAGVRRVFDLMKDGQWHTRTEIMLAAGEHGVPASEGLRRMRELRRWFRVETQRVPESRDWVYRLVLPAPRKPEQLSFNLPYGGYRG